MPPHKVMQGLIGSNKRSPQKSQPNIQAIKKSAQPKVN